MATIQELRKIVNYDIISDFQEGMAIATKDGQWFHIKPNGFPVYEESYSDVGLFWNGLAAVKKDGQWFHIKPDGTPAYEERYDTVGDFVNDRVLVIPQDGGKGFRIGLDGVRVD